MANTTGKADHKAQPTTTLPTINGLDPKTIAGTIITAIIQINSALAGFGVTPVPVDEQGVYTGVSIVVALINVAYAVWTNFNFTPAARQGQAVTDAIKLAEKTGNTPDMPAATEAVAEPEPTTPAQHLALNSALKTDAAGNPVLDEQTGTPIIEV